jgi:hypothetical protein
MVRTPRRTAVAIITLWVMSMSFRRSSASATVPPTSEKIAIGTTRASPIIPSATAEWVRV